MRSMAAWFAKLPEQNWIQDCRAKGSQRRWSRCRFLRSKPKCSFSIGLDMTSPGLKILTVKNRNPPVSQPTVPNR
jgi:hypothetical protein